MTVPRISFVVPAYNSIATLPQTLDSILAQKISAPSEILVIDDCSTDKTQDMLSKYKVRSIRNLQNKGAAYSRNLGIRESLGEIVILVDSDVRLEPGLAESFLKIFDTAPEISLTAPTIRYETQGDFYPGFPEAAQYAGVTACLGVRKSALVNAHAQFDESYGIFFEDTDFFIRLRHAGLKFRYVAEATAIHKDRSIREDNEHTYFLQIRNCLYALRKLRGLPRFSHELSWKLYLKYLAFGLLNYAWFNDWYQSGNRNFRQKLFSKLKGPKIIPSPLWPIRISGVIAKSWIWNLTRSPQNVGK